MTSTARFEQLVRPHLDAAYNLAYWIVRNPTEAEDVVQDACLRACRAFSGFHGEAMRPWLLAIVRNAAYRHLQVRKRAGAIVPLLSEAGSQAQQTMLDVASEEPSAEDVLIAEDDRARVRRALASLSSGHREIIVLREVEGCSYTEIAQVLTIPVGTVMSRLARARAELRTVYQQNEREECLRGM